MSDRVNCELCGEPMPNGEEMFKYHGYSGPCPKPAAGKKAPVPLTALETNLLDALKNLVDLAKNQVADAEDWHDYQHAVAAIAKAEERP